MGAIKNLTVGAWHLLTYPLYKYYCEEDNRKEEKRLKEYISDDDYLPIREQAVSQIIMRLKGLSSNNERACKLIDNIVEELRISGVTPRESDLVDQLGDIVQSYELFSVMQEEITKLENIIMKIRETNERMAMKRHFLSSPYKDTKVTFTNIDNKSEHKSLVMQEDTKYAEPGSIDYNTEPDRLFHATVTVKGFDSNNNDPVLLTKDVYFYQPRLNYITKTSTGTHSTFIGPKFLRNGTMNLNAPYCFNSGNKLFYGSLPKREVLSNRVFDFDLSNAKSFDATVKDLFKDKDVNPDDVRRFVSVKFDTDRQGYLKPIPKEKEMEVITKYKKSGNHIDVEDVVSTLNSQLQKLKKYKEQKEIEARARSEANRKAQEQAERASQEQTSKVARDQADAARLEADNARILNNRLNYGTLNPAMQGLSQEALAAEGYKVTGGRPMGGGPSVGSMPNRGPRR